MFTSEELDSWNELFPDCQITEKDLANPTETFLTRTLVAYIRSLGYKVDVAPAYMDSSDNSREKRLFLIKVSQQIDHVLKITDKSYTFFYYDLIRPTPKKTSHTLGILLNYLYYYNMFKTNVFTMANDRVVVRQELQQRISNTQQENEQRQSRAKKIKEEIEEFCEQLPKLEVEVKMLKTQKAKEKAELLKLQDSIKDLTGSISEMKKQCSNLEKQLVPEGEAHELQTQIAKLKDSIAERKRLECTAESTLVAHNENINTLQELLDRIEKAKKVLPCSLLTDCKEMQRNLTEIKIQMASATAKKEEHLLMAQKFKRDLEAVEQKFRIKKTQVEKDQLEKLQQVESSEKICSMNIVKLTQLEQEDHALECLLEEQKDIRCYLQENINELLVGYKRKLI